MQRFQAQWLKGAIAAGLAVIAGAAGIACARPLAMLGPSDGFSLDQPRVTVRFYEAGDLTPLGPDGSGLFYYADQFLLDTGANGILIAAIAVEEMVPKGYNTVATYYESGVAGMQALDVSEPMVMQYAGSSGEPNLLEDVYALSSESADFGGFGGILGMPGMVGKVVTWDFIKWANGDLWDFYMGLAFSETIPEPNAPRYTVNLQMREFPQSGKVNPEDPDLTWAPLPFVRTRVCNGPYWHEGDFLLDSGAQLSIISTKTAIALGLDTNGNGIIDMDSEAGDVLEIGGIGGSLWAPVVQISQIRIPTAQGPSLAWTDPILVVVDIGDIDGIVGMELFTSGWFEVVFGATGGTGWLDKVHLDFRHVETGAAEMYVDVNSNHHNVRLAQIDESPSYDLYDYSLLASHWLDSGCTIEACSGADLDGSGFVDVGDVLILRKHWLAEPGAPPTPSYDLTDFAQFAARWLDIDCQTPTWCEAGDRTRDGVVDAADLAEFLGYWLGQ